MHVLSTSNPLALSHRNPNTFIYEAATHNHLIRPKTFYHKKHNRKPIKLTQFLVTDADRNNRMAGFLNEAIRVQNGTFLNVPITQLSDFKTYK